MKKSEMTRRFIIEKAAVLFNQKGFNGTSIQDIMEATGMSKGGIYGNFKKDGMSKEGVKEEIALAAFDHAVAKVYLEIGKRTKVIENAIDKLKAVVFFYKERVLNPPVEGGCPIQNSSIEANGNLPFLNKKVRFATEEWHRRIVRTIEKGIEKGEIDKKTDASEFAMIYISMIEGGVLGAKLWNSNKPFDAMSKKLIQLIEDLKPK